LGNAALNDSTRLRGVERGKGTRDSIGMLRIISERTLERDGEVCVCFIDRQKAFDRVNEDPKGN
jgi:hypothetical protein